MQPAAPLLRMHISGCSRIVLATVRKYAACRWYDYQESTEQMINWHSESHDADSMRMYFESMVAFNYA